MTTGCYIRTDETKRRMSIAQKGRIFSKEHRKKISISKKGKHFPKLSKALKDRIISKEWKEKMKASQKGEKHYNWKGGRRITKDGYVEIWIPKRRSNGNKIYKLRSHIVTEQHIGRELTNKEVVHHINKIKNDDRIENLRLFKNNGEHIKYHRRLEREFI